MRRERRAGGFEAAYLTNNIRTEKFTDEQFSTADALYWSDYTIEKTSKVAKQLPQIDWARVVEKKPTHTLWGPKGVNPNDIA